MSLTLTAPPMFFDTTKPRPTTPNGCKLAYWKLITYAALRRSEGTAFALKNRLRALGVYVKTTAAAKRCEKLLQRYERDLLAYEAFPTADLNKFAKNRRLVCKPECSQHAKIVKLLEKAADEQTFEKFLDLPCEMRLMVYEFHLGNLELPKRRRSGRPPPLCRVSLLLRKEELPLFVAKEEKEREQFWKFVSC